MRQLIIFLIVSIALSSCSIVHNPRVIADDQNPEFLPLNKVNLSSVNRSLFLAAEWLLNNQEKDGSIKYRYIPEKEEYLKSNNMIRQFMATIALAEMYNFSSEVEFKRSYEENLRFNFDNYYRWNPRFGYISYRNTVKLGAAAFAWWALSYTEDSWYSEKREMLEKFIFYMHNNTNGKFKSFYYPDIERNQNFYPGEAMLALMVYYEKTNNSKYLNAVKKSFDYYKDFFRRKSNPAFVPWHTMADYRLYKATSNITYADFIFEMNDFLINIQHLECGPDRRFLGRFYDPEHREYGPPHASSTAVYVEGLTYAYRLAREQGDKKHEEKYREAIILGVRSLMQLQSKEGDFRVKGGIRKTVNNSEIRIDNVQHTMMAFMEFLKVFDEEEIKAFIESYNGC